ncbi:MAG: hypothetical protein RLZZ323_369 [Bacteroidota bacterium]|jgi:hypothetical protein
MIKNLLILIGIFISFNCNSQNIVSKTKHKSIPRIPLRKKIIGIWTQKGSINADFKIDNERFYYVDDFEFYKYSLNGDIIKIYYTDYIYEGKVSFKNDTLIISNKDGEGRYLRFKEKNIK